MPIHVCLKPTILTLWYLRGWIFHCYSLTPVFLSGKLVLCLLLVLHLSVFHRWQAAQGTVWCTVGCGVLPWEWESVASVLSYADKKKDKSAGPRCRGEVSSYRAEIKEIKSITDLSRKRRRRRGDCLFKWKTSRYPGRKSEKHFAVDEG